MVRWYAIKNSRKAIHNGKQISGGIIVRYSKYIFMSCINQTFIYGSICYLHRNTHWPFFVLNIIPLLSVWQWAEKCSKYVWDGEIELFFGKFKWFWRDFLPFFIHSLKRSTWFAAIFTQRGILTKMKIFEHAFYHPTPTEQTLSKHDVTHTHKHFYYQLKRIS